MNEYIFYFFPVDFSYIQYQGDSYMEFQGFHLQPQNNITLQFQTFGLQGLLLYVEQTPATVGHSFIQVSVKHGVLQVMLQIIVTMQLH